MELLNTRSQSLDAVVAAYSSKVLGCSQKGVFLSNYCCLRLILSVQSIHGNFPY
jgi:hypothetical protein